MKRILIVLLLLVCLTGCRCEYNLTINGSTYSENIVITGDNSEEINSFNESWQVPTNKEEYNIGTDDDSNLDIISNVYDYNLNDDKLSFSHSFTENEIINSTAISNCYKYINVTSYDNSIIISSSSNVTCFDKYPDLNSVTINITVDRPVIASNADMSNNNTYTWRLTRNNTKAIDMTIDDSSESFISTSNVENNDNTSFFTFDNIKSLDMERYIFAVILFIVLLIAYAVVNNIKNKDDDIDDTNDMDDIDE